ncbi:MAG: hypothetical protein ACOYNM_05830, partial [Gemmataceae bacterium]
MKTELQGNTGFEINLNGSVIAAIALCWSYLIRTSHLLSPLLDDSPLARNFILGAIVIGIAFCMYIVFPIHNNCYYGDV